MSINQYVNFLESKGLTVYVFGRNCPIEVHASWANGNHLYFRARGDEWNITVATNEDDAIEGDYKKDTILYYSAGSHAGAGYMPICEAYKIVLDAIEAVNNGGF